MALLGAIPAAAGAQGPSVLDARGEPAAQILEITWVLLIGGGVIFLAVMLVAALALAGPAPARAAIGRHAWIVGAGIVFPVVVLSALLVYTLVAAAGMVRSQQSPAATSVEVTGELWWWRVRYRDASGQAVLETANEIRIPAGRPVDLRLLSSNVIHSVWVPNLAGKLDMIPGRVNRLRLQADAPGVFRGQCAEFCGAQHANMALQVIAMAPPEYEAWLAAHSRPAAVPVDPLPRRGQALFADNRCGLCHAVRGTPARGTLGPDLTHVGSRTQLAAGTLPNGSAALAAWITTSQHVKPGSLMPAYRQFSPEDLDALVAYLESLR